MKVAILGAGGTIAPAIIRDLAEADEVTQLKLLDINLQSAVDAADQFGQGKATAHTVDARSDLAPALHDCDVLVNAASYRINLDAMQACLASGSNYIDLGGLYWVTGDQLELDDVFRAAGLTAVLGIGSAPGKTNVMAARAVRELEVVESIHVSAAGRDLDPPPGLNPPYALQTIIDELTLAPIVLRDGVPVEIMPLADGGEVDFPPPAGHAATVYTLHSELRTFADSFGCREASFRLSLPGALLEEISALADAPSEVIAAAASGRQSASTVAFHVVDAAGGGLKVRVACVTSPMAQWGLGGGVVSTAAPAAATVRLMARGKLTATGVHAPETCIDPDDLFPLLEQRGSVFTIETTEL